MNQITSNILMVRPSNFGFNLDTANNNSFQVNDETLSKEEIIHRARIEFDRFVGILQNTGIQVQVYQEKEGATSTDSVFPNNWFSCHHNGSFITYPMFSQKRRSERESGVFSKLTAKFQVKRRLRLEHWEKENFFLEGTGSMVFDRQNKIAYACRSNRTDEVVLDEFCELMRYSKFLFDSVDRKGLPIYHTNVMMAIGTSFVVICLESVKSKDQREKLAESFRATNKEIIEISLNQVEQFAGNMIQVKNTQGDFFLVMSTSAFDSLRPEQLMRIKKHTQVIHADLRIIETYGGGSARCMIAELFLPFSN